MIQPGRFSLAVVCATIASLASFALTAAAYDDVVTLRKGNEKLTGRISTCELDNISVEIKDKKQFDARYESGWHDSLRPEVSARQNPIAAIKTSRAYRRTAA